MILKQEYDLVIIGGGPAGLAAAIAAKKQGIDRLLILERDSMLGGILNQCIHNGFGLHTFQEELTGPEYAARFINQAKELKIEFKLNTMVLSISKQKLITAVNRTDGLMQIQARAVILAMGCRERPRGALNIPGFRPAGIYSAGTAQRLVNIEGFLPGREVVILGSGDIGLIMARRMTLEGAKVKVVAELMPYSGGLKRNIVQCLDDFGIPLKLSHTVVDIQGKERVSGIDLAQVDSQGRPIPGTEEHYSCDTLLLSCGLLPENELSKDMGVAINPVTGGPVVNECLETNIEGVFACGNVLHVHDLVDFVSQEASSAGENAALYLKSSKEDSSSPAHCAKSREISTDRCSYKDQEKATDHSLPAPDKDENSPYADVCAKNKLAGKTPQSSAERIPIQPVSGVRYTVPSLVNIDRMPDRLTVRFRVGKVFKDSFVSLYLNDQRTLHLKKQILTPGQMESVILSKKDLISYKDLQSITLKIEEA